MDNRSEPRVEHQIRFFVHVHECDEDPDMVGVSVACEALDFSSHGLQLKTDRTLPTKTKLNITIGIGDPFAMYLLRGEVRWAKPGDDECYMGVLLSDEEGTDLEAWVAQFENLFET
jgi:hypothetical protein